MERQKTKKKRSAWPALILVSLPFLAGSAPDVPIWGGMTIFILCGLLVVAPTIRPGVRRILGLSGSGRLGSMVRVIGWGLYSLFLISLGLTGKTELKAQAAANLKVAGLVSQAHAALQDGKVEEARDLAQRAVAVPRSKSQSEPRRILQKIDQSSRDDYLVGVLARLPKSDFERFQDEEYVPGALDFGFPVLNERAVKLARELTDQAVERRQALAEQQERDRQRRASRAKREAQRKPPKRNLTHALSTYRSLLESTNVSVVERLEAEEVVPGVLELTLTVGNRWHVRHYQVRLQDAQTLWRAWAATVSPEATDSARIKIVDRMGNEVGGSRLLGGSLIWVKED